MLVGVYWKQLLNVIRDEGLKVLGKTCKELKHLRVEDDDVGYIIEWHGCYFTRLCKVAIFVLICM